jgi:bacterioferritin
VVSSGLYPSGHGSIEYLASGRKDGPPILLLNEVDVPVFVSTSTFLFRCDHARSGLSASCIGAVTSNKEQFVKGNPKVIDYLNKALRHELTAVNQYWLHYRLLGNWGYKVLAKQWRKESIEEMQHADKLIERIIFLDGIPNMQTLESLHIGKTVKEVLDRDLQAEMEARTLYEEAATYCHSAKDYVTRELFEQLMRDEEHHIDFLETQLDLVAKLGPELYAQHHIGELDES